jgi:iron complex outermembrane receptor protein
MSGRYTSFQDAPFFTPILGAGGQPLGGTTQSAGDASDFDTVRTPKTTAMIAADYRVRIPGGNLSFTASYYSNGGFAWDPDNRLRQPSYDVLSISVGWNATDERWGVRLWARNLTGTEYCAFAAARTLLDSCSPAPPRTYGITFHTRYQS